MPEQLPYPTAPDTPAAQDAAPLQRQSVPAELPLGQPFEGHPAQIPPKPVPLLKATPQMLPFPPNPPPPLPNGEMPQRIPYWLQQAERFLRVIVRIYIGLVVCLVPWYPPFWDANPLFTHFPSVASFITHGAVRGFVSGFGLLNLWVALQDMIRLPDHPRPQ